MRHTKKLLSVLLMLTVLVSVSGLTASAANDDPAITAYNYQYTYVVDVDTIGTGTSVDIYAVPAAEEYFLDSTPTWFTTAEAAEDIVWTRTVGSTAGITAGAVSGYEYDTVNHYFASCLTVNIAAGNEPGPASFRATNPNSSPTAGAHVDITVIVNDNDNNDNPDEDEYFVAFMAYEPTSPNPTLHANIAVQTNAGLHTDGRSYITVFDCVEKMEDVGVIDGYTEGMNLPNITSMTFGANTYVNADAGYWQCRAYTFNTSTYQYEIVPISEVIWWISNMDARTIDLIVWRYGSYNDGTCFQPRFPEWRANRPALGRGRHANPD